jgi:hypothetical protein
LAGGVGEEKDFRLSSDLNYVGPADYIGEKLVADLPKIYKEERKLAEKSLTLRESYRVVPTI